MPIARASVLIRSDSIRSAICHRIAIHAHYSSLEITFSTVRRLADENGNREFYRWKSRLLSPQTFSTIYVTGLPRHMSSWELAEICRPYGEVLAAQVESDPETGTPWRFGFVAFDTPQSASRAAAALHGKRYRGDVLAARPIDQSKPEQLALVSTDSIDRDGTDGSAEPLAISRPHCNRR